MRRERIKEVKLDSVAHSYQGSEKLLDNVNITFPLGKIVVLEGSPGSGKSLMLKIAAGLVEPTHGKVLYNGLNLNDMSFEDFAPLRTSTSICFENGGLLMNKTLAENIKLPLSYNKQWRADRSNVYFEEITNHFGLKPFLNLRPAAVSAGIRKITGIVRTFLCTPQIIYLDEPSLGLGDEGAEALKQWIIKYRKEGKSDELIVMACSDSRFIENFECDRYVIKNKMLCPRGEEGAKVA